MRIRNRQAGKGWGTRAAASLTAAICAAGILSGCEPKKPVAPFSGNLLELDNVPTKEEVIMRDLSGDTAMAKSLVFANEVKNSVQGRYVDGLRSIYSLDNIGTRITESLRTDGTLGISEITDKNGCVYAADPMSAFVVDENGTEYLDRYSSTVGRINTTRLGYYYYESFLRDQTFGTAEAGSFSYRDETPIGDFESAWKCSSDAKLTYNDGKSVTMTVINTLDPYIFIRMPGAIAQEKVTHVAVTMAVTGAGGRSQLFYTDTKSGEFNSKQYLDFYIANDGEFHTYLLDVRGQLKADLNGIRIDAGQNVGDTVTISEVKAVTLDEKTVQAYGERCLDVFPDKVHQSYRLVPMPDYRPLRAFGMVWQMPADKVEALEIRDAAGTHAEPDADPATVEYVAFLVKDAGVAGIIIPSDGSTLKTEVTLENGIYTVRQYASGDLDIPKSKSVTFGHRLYTEKDPDFAGIQRAAYLERHPLTNDNFTAEGGNRVRSKFVGYDAIKGMYYFTTGGYSFDVAFREENRNVNAPIHVNVQNDSEDRTCYLWMRGTPGTIECAAILDENELFLPLPVEVCKNFDCEKEEPVYDPKDVSFSDTVFPVVMEKGEKLAFTDLHLYMNWGKNMLKQISSIQFFVSYYHLSTGVSESNCISFYGVHGKDGFLLPDFRGHSGIRWKVDPQFTSVAKPCGVSYIDNDGNLVMPEYSRSLIRCSGPTYADLAYDYVSDCGSFRYTLRHVEFPQSDENRTYYTMDLEFLRPLTLNDVRTQLSLLSQNSYGQIFHEMSYRDPAGSRKSVELDVESAWRDETVYLLNPKGWYTYYHSNRPVITETAGQEDPMNYAVVLKNSDIVIGGKPWNGNFVLRDAYANKLNLSALSLDLGKTTFLAGDRIHLEFLMLPWASRDLASDENVVRVFEDSVEKPLTVVSVNGGEAIPDCYLARVKTNDGKTVELTVKGSRNNNVIRADGFTKLTRPVVEQKQADGSWQVLVLNVLEYDGYGIHLGEDGTYGYSFVYESQGPDSESTFRITAG